MCIPFQHFPTFPSWWKQLGFWAPGKAPTFSHSPLSVAQSLTDLAASESKGLPGASWARALELDFFRDQLVPPAPVFLGGVQGKPKGKPPVSEIPKTYFLVQVQKAKASLGTRSQKPFPGSKGAPPDWGSQKGKTQHLNSCGEDMWGPQLPMSSCGNNYVLSGAHMQSFPSNWFDITCQVHSRCLNRKSRGLNLNRLCLQMAKPLGQLVPCTMGRVSKIPC